MEIAANSSKMSFSSSIPQSIHAQRKAITNKTLSDSEGALASPPSIEFLVLFTIFIDTIVIVAAFFLAMWNHGEINFISAVYEILAGQYSAYILVGTLLYLVILGFIGGYTQHSFLSPNLLYQVFKTSSMWLVIFLALALALKLQPPISRYFFVWAFLNSWVLLSAWRLALRQLLLEGNWLATLRERVLVVGWSKESDLLSHKIMQDSGHRYEIIGCTPSAHGKFWVEPPRQVPVLGDYNSLAEIISEYKPNIIITADLDPVMGEIIALAELCEREHVQFKVIPSYFQTFTSGLHLEHVSGVPVLGISKLPLDHVFNRIVKRAIDVVGSIVGLMLSAPLILIFGYLIQRESPGPIFYSQIRLGKSGKEFRIYKLRSMRLDAETTGAQWTRENDPRRLKIGELMRKWNIDEVPQFWNVLVGDMSLVGPRPERPEHIERLKEEIRHYNARHYSKPGLTGFAQVNGMRGDTDITARVRYDLYYLENWTAFLDIYVMIRTFFAHSGAY
jgi:exopolysaccharide biosynthesis polyprenyl glycosylphosphotransferase